MTTKRPPIKTTVSEIVEYWARHICESDLSVDFSEAHERCWRCGCKRKLERCHIVPHALGGLDEPSNFVLLCGRCHLDNPNVSNPQIMWDWLKAYKTTFYDTFWMLRGMEEYEKMYSRSFQTELKDRGLEDDSDMEEILKDKVNGASYHFGDPHFNSATIAGILRMTLLEYDQRSKR